MERTYVFNQDGNNGNGGGSKFDIMAMLPNLMGSKGVDPGLLALLNQGRGSQDQWGGSWWFIWIILLWFCWGGNGFGNRFGNGGGLPAELNGDVGREYLMSAIQGNGNAINQLASSLNCSTQQLQSALCNIQGLSPMWAIRSACLPSKSSTHSSPAIRLFLLRLQTAAAKIRQQLSVKGMKAA